MGNLRNRLGGLALILRLHGGHVLQFAVLAAALGLAVALARPGATPF